MINFLADSVNQHHMLASPETWQSDNQAIACNDVRCTSQVSQVSWHEDQGPAATTIAATIIANCDSVDFSTIFFASAEKGTWSSRHRYVALEARPQELQSSGNRMRHSTLSMETTYVKVLYKYGQVLYNGTYKALL